MTDKSSFIPICPLSLYACLPTRVQSDLSILQPTVPDKEKVQRFYIISKSGQALKWEHLVFT